MRGGDQASRLDSWSEILAATHLAFDVQPDVPHAGALSGRGHPPRDRRPDAGRLRRVAVPRPPQPRP